jgi:hypothetical protein
MGDIAVHLPFSGKGRCVNRKMECCVTRPFREKDRHCMSVGGPFSYPGGPTQVLCSRCHPRWSLNHSLQSNR